MDPGPANPPPGLCGTCRHARFIRSDRGQRFIRCSMSDADQRYMRYPPLPVAICQGYDLIADKDEGRRMRHERL
jgi:hypothetical protein